MKLRDWITLSPLFIKYLGRLPLSHLIYLARQFCNENPHRHDGRLMINTFFPPYPSKAFDRFVDSAVKLKRIPYSTYFAVTDACPYACPHCSYGSHEAGRLDTEKALQVVEQIRSLGTITIGFTGGEPLLRRDLAELITATGDDVATVLFTTGYGLDAARAKELKTSGLDCIMIGLESDVAVEHDWVRGVEGSFEQGIQAIALAREAGLYAAISTVGTRAKLQAGTIERMATLAEKLGVHEFRVLEPVPTGSFADCPGEVLTAAESRELSDFHKQWNKRNRGPAIAAFSYLESEEMFGCGAGYHHLFIDAIGNVCPCDLTPLSYGNVFDEPLVDIWRRMGEAFDLPRCGCLMKEICKNSLILSPGETLPLPPEQAVPICHSIKREGGLPKIYQNLFKGRKPVDP